MSISNLFPIEKIPEELRNPISEWFKLDKNEVTRNEVNELCKSNNWEELHKRFDKRIVFGTAGLRSTMEAGFNRMNSLVILQTSQGLADYLKKTNPTNLTFVIGHDHRFNSYEFASVTTAVFLNAGFKVYSLNPKYKLVHTPLVPFSVDQLKAAAGVMITASHNPMMDNGYKVYYSNGCQIIPPHDKNISESIEENLEPSINEWNWEVILKEGEKAGNLVYVKRDMTDCYVNNMKNSLIDKLLISRLSEMKQKPWFVYTPMHGVGHEIFARITSELLNLHENVDYISVPEQIEPDPKFPTVSFPNPEEKGALDLAISLAEHTGINLVIANDPDADRFSIAVKDKKNNVWKQISGDEIGFLFAYYEYQKYNKMDDKFKQIHPLAMLNSTVSSQMMKRMADIEGFLYEDTLTGFKWIGNRALELEKEGYYVPIGYEEAIGYMFPIMEHDKDGISAAIVFMQAYCNWIIQDNKYPLEILEEGYSKYGFYKQYNGYYKLKDLTVTKKIFDFIRYDYEPKQKQYPHQIDNQLKIVIFRDLTKGFQSNTVDNIPNLPVDPTSQMITITARTEHPEDSNELIRFTMRGSGTEPKLKVYIEASAKTESRANYLTKLTWNLLKKEWFRPKNTGLTTPF